MFIIIISAISVIILLCYIIAKSCRAHDETLNKIIQNRDKGVL